ncbi:uncharacterized protein LOC120326084 isoform X1 [Styela clava]
MNILILYITLCTALSSVNALTPQILMSINEGVNRRQHVPVNPDENLITAVCKTNLEMVETNATTTALSADTSPTNSIVDIYRKCKVSGTRYCRLRLLQPERRYLISREINWTKNYSVIATKYQSIPVDCHENDVSNYAKIIFQDHFETNSTKHVSLYSISQCEEDEEHGYGFYVTMCIFGFLTILVVIGTLLDLCTGFHQNKTQYIEGKRKKQTSVPGWRSLFANRGTKLEDSAKQSVPRIIISDPAKTANVVRRDSLDSILSTDCGGPQIAPINMPSLSSIRSENSISRGSAKISVHRSPSPRHNLLRASSLANTGTSVKSQSFTDISGVSASFGSVHETLNFSNPSVFVSPLEQMSQSDQYIGSTSGDSIQISENSFIKKGYASSVEPTKNTNLFLDAVMKSSASQGIRGHEYDDSSMFICSIQTIAVWWYLLYLTAIFFGTSELLDNPDDFKNRILDTGFQFVMNGSMHIYTVLFTSAMLLGYSAVQRLKNTKTLTEGMVNALAMICTKYCEQFPFYILVILLWTYVIPGIASGPMWNLLRDGSCIDFWWTNVIYINNFYPEKSVLQCMPWTWFIASEMQMFIFGSILVLLFCKCKRLAVFITFVSVVLVNSICAYIAYKRSLDLTPLAELYKELRNTSMESHGGWKNEVFDSLFNKPYFHWSLYVVGIIIGATIRHRTTFRKMTLICTLLLYIVSIPCHFATMHYVVVIKKNLTEKWNPLFINLVPKIWILFLVPTLIYFRYSRIKGPINKLLCSSCWGNLSRLNIPVLVANPIILHMLFFSADFAIHFNLMNLIVYFLATLALTYLLVAVLLIFGHYPLYFILRLAYLYVMPQSTDKHAETTSKEDESFLINVNARGKNKKRKKSRQRLGPRSLLDIKRSSFSSRSYQRSFESLFTHVVRA